MTIGITPAKNANQSDKLDSLGITVVPLVVYEWGGYRYSNASDAIAAAERAAR